MLTLNTFGSLTLLDAGGKELHAVLSQPKRLAVLVYLAVAQPRGLHRRDTLLTLFWPERDEAHARNALSQSLSFLRQHLPADLFSGRGSERIGVVSGILASDVEIFSAAIMEHRWAEAVDLYQGDFLSGFHVGGAWGFGNWVEDERTRLRKEAAGAAWSLALEQIDRGVLEEAHRSARKGLSLAGMDEKPVREFIDALAGAGDRAAALTFFEGYCERLRREMDLEPSPRTLEVAATIRNGEGSRNDRQPTPDQTPAEDRTSASDQTLTSAVAANLPEPDSSDHPSPSATLHQESSLSYQGSALRRPRSRRKYRWPRILVAAGLLGAGLLGLSKGVPVLRRALASVASPSYPGVPVFSAWESQLVGGHAPFFSTTDSLLLLGVRDTLFVYDEERWRAFPFPDSLR
ncbi:MAG: hypothetical protein HKO65_11695, partial [Gemmatimonadetes bacterium]|nr:hypothetical protein [Gemmatimonadota bacterium]